MIRNLPQFTPRQFEVAAVGVDRAASHANFDVEVRRHQSRQAPPVHAFVAELLLRDVRAAWRVALPHRLATPARRTTLEVGAPHDNAVAFGEAM
jgi:hypothetical protein